MPPVTPPRIGGDTPDAGRRAALKLFASGAAALVAGCRPAAEMRPYVALPEGMVPGETMRFATALPLGGAGRGVVVESFQGRPIKVHGNERHPASLGATDAFAEAELLSLFDPERSGAPVAGPVPQSWSAVGRRLRDAAAADGTVLLTGPVGSPTAARQIAGLLESRPGLRWMVHRRAIPELEVPFGPDLAQRMQVWPDFDRLRGLVTLGADPLGPGPGQVGFASGWAKARSAARSDWRAHAFEAVPGLTGAKADHRTPVRPDRFGDVAQALLAALDGGDASAPVQRAARDLRRGGGVVLADPTLPVAVHALVARINDRIAAPLRLWRPFWHWDGLAPEAATGLPEAVAAGETGAVIALGVNPAYDLPGFAEAVRSSGVDLLHLGLMQDETAVLAGLHAPLHHPLEDWSDLRAIDSSVAPVQPLIRPLFDTRSPHEVLAMMAGRYGVEAQEIVQQTWRAAWGAERFGATWAAALEAGVMPDTGPRERAAPDFGDGGSAERGAGAFALIARPSPSVWAGEYAPNAWLQECPAPLTKQVWGNAASLSPADAARLGIAEGDAVAVGGPDGSAILPAVILPGQADGVIGTTLGYGRRDAGQIGTRVGGDVGALAARVDVERVSAEGGLLRTQTEFGQHGREILREVTRAAPELEAHHETPGFFPDRDYGSPSWAMVIDTDACIGCNACVLSCQSENNVPVVGPEEIAKGRRMHWLRIDAYDTADGTRAFQPVPCQHCEKAPCEPVCPVAASVHDEQGLNAQVYNRCIGTRFCQANCPYQVRRFNYFDYADGQAYGGLGADLLQALANPRVSVRGRGVMEKCTYCVQRIEAAHHEVSRGGDDSAYAEVRTACQSACPAQAITFGNLADADSPVTRARHDGRNYALLAHLGTEPRTTYLARIVPGDDPEGEGA